MQGLWQVAVVAVLVIEALAPGQGSDAAKVLAEVRAALGGEAGVAAVKTVMVEGTRTRIVAEGQSRPSGFTMAMELPARFARREVAGNINGTDITRTSGFNGSDVIERTDLPPGMAGGRGTMVMRMGPGGATSGEMTPEQQAAQRAAAISAAKRDFARFALGMFGGRSDVYPVEFAYAGIAESPDTKAHVLAVTGPDGFEAKFFVDTTSHLPLMLTWMDREPMMMTAGGPGGGRGGGGMQIVQRGGSPEDVQRMRAEMEQQMREMEANGRTVEFRLYYADYKSFDGVRLPTRLQRMIDGSIVEELAFDKVSVNGPIDAKFFEVASGR